MSLSVNSNLSQTSSRPNNGPIPYLSQNSTLSQNSMSNSINLSTSNQDLQRSTNSNSNQSNLNPNLPASLRLNSHILNKYLDLKIDSIDRDRITKLEEKNSLDIFTPDV